MRDLITVRFLSVNLRLFQAFDHILAAVEDIAGLNGYHHWRDKSVPLIVTDL